MIVITTPTGQIGRQVLGNLLDSGEQLRVIARDPSQLPAEVREDLDIVEGSHGDAAVADKAFAGADAVFWLTPADPRAPSVEAAFAGFTRPAAEAFKRHGVGRVVGVSMLGRGTPWAGRAGFVTSSLAIANCRPSPPATSPPRPRVCCSTQAGAAPARSRCSDPRICLSTTWPRPCRRCSARKSASADHVRGLQGQVRSPRHVPCDGSGVYRHGLGEERGP